MGLGCGVYRACGLGFEAQCLGAYFEGGLQGNVRRNGYCTFMTVKLYSTRPLLLMFGLRVYGEPGIRKRLKLPLTCWKRLAETLSAAHSDCADVPGCKR